MTMQPIHHIDPVRLALSEAREAATKVSDELNAQHDIARPSDALMRAIENPEMEFLRMIVQDPAVAAELENMPENVLPWDRFPMEPKSAWIEFQDYLALGPRRGSRQTETAILWSWTFRARLWDEYCFFTKQREELAATAEISRRHVLIARALQAKGLEALENLDLDLLKGADVIRMIATGLQAEAEALQLPDKLNKNTPKRSNSRERDSDVTVNVTQQVMAPQMSPESLKLMMARERIIEVSEVVVTDDNDE